MSDPRRSGKVTGFSVLTGNMPFLGGRRIATEHGERYAGWLTDQFSGTGGTDYVGYFLLRGANLLSERGTVGFIATDAISDGDNRRTTLARLLSAEGGFELYRAQDGLPWPGNAAVLIAVLHLARGGVAAEVRANVLNGERVSSINSRLRAGPERPEPVALTENAGYAFVGCFLRGDGFVLSEAEGEELLRKSPCEGRVVRKFLVGDDLNNRPNQTPSRYVVSFEDMSLEEARHFPSAFAVVSERVRPQRERLKSTGVDADHKKHWWRFANTRRELRERLASTGRVIATARVSKHVLFSFASADWVPSEQVVVFPFDSLSLFGVLQSRVHGLWVRLMAGARGEGVRYSASECFDGFPFPEPSPLAVLPGVERAASALCEARSRYLSDSRVGLTETYNRLFDPKCIDESIIALRRLHEDLDRAVIGAYRWAGLRVPAFCDSDSNLEAAVIDRLFQLNAERGGAPSLEASVGPKVKKAQPRRQAVRKKAAGSDGG